MSKPILKRKKTPEQIAYLNQKSKQKIMPENRTGAQIAEAFTDAVDSIISKVGTTPATNQELIDVCNAVLTKCFIVAPVAVVESSMSISPTHTATPAVRFKNA